MRTAEHYFKCRWTTPTAAPGRRDHQGLRPRVRLPGPPERPPRCRGCCTCRAARAAAATASRRWAGGARRRPRLPHPDAGPARHRAVLPGRPPTLPLRGDAAARRTTSRTSAPTRSCRRRADPAGAGQRAVDGLRPELRRLLRAELPLLGPGGSAGSADHRRPRPAGRPRGPGLPGHVPARGGAQRRVLRPLPGGPRSVTRIARHLGNRGILPDGERLTVALPDGRLLPGRQRPHRALHYLLEDAFVATPAGAASPTRSWTSSAGSCPAPPTRCTR